MQIYELKIHCNIFKTPRKKNKVKIMYGQL